jgi:5-methylcytosine-specific restriction endonuclease McrA
MKRQQTPVCEVCNDAIADDVDHIAPFNGVDDPKRTEWQNLQSICRACHNGKTHRRNGKMG